MLPSSRLAVAAPIPLGTWSLIQSVTSPLAVGLPTTARVLTMVGKNITTARSPESDACRAGLWLNHPHIVSRRRAGLTCRDRRQYGHRFQPRSRGHRDDHEKMARYIPRCEYIPYGFSCNERDSRQGRSNRRCWDIRQDMHATCSFPRNMI